MNADPSITRPLFRYHGGKFRLAPWLLEFFPPHKTYVEPFGGGASILLRKPRCAREIYNDLDGEVVNVFRVMRESPAALIRAIELTPYARAEHELSFQPAADPVEQARRTIARSFMSYGTTFTRRNVTNGKLQRTGFRAMRRDATTTAMDWAGLPEAFQAVASRLSGVLIEQRDACQVMADHDSPSTLHYVDPPYVHSTRASASSKSHLGYAIELSDDDHRRIAKTVRGLAGAVIISGYPCDLYDRELYADFDRSERPHHALNAADRTEVIWTRNLQPDLFRLTA